MQHRKVKRQTRSTYCHFSDVRDLITPWGIKKQVFGVVWRGSQNIWNSQNLATDSEQTQERKSIEADALFSLRLENRCIKKALSSKVNACSLRPCRSTWAWGHRVWWKPEPGWSAHGQVHLWHFIVPWKWWNNALTLLSPEKIMCIQSQTNYFFFLGRNVCNLRRSSGLHAVTVNLAAAGKHFQPSKALCWARKARRHKPLSRFGPRSFEYFKVNYSRDIIWTSADLSRE